MAGWQHEGRQWLAKAGRQADARARGGQGCFLSVSDRHLSLSSVVWTSLSPLSLSHSVSYLSPLSQFSLFKNTCYNLPVYHPLPLAAVPFSSLLVMPSVVWRSTAASTCLSLPCLPWRTRRTVTFSAVCCAREKQKGKRNFLFALAFYVFVYFCAPLHFLKQVKTKHRKRKKRKKAARFPTISRAYMVLCMPYAVALTPAFMPYILYLL